MNLQPWQEKLLADIKTSEFPPGELMVVYAGRGTGKSLWSAPRQAPYQVLGSATLCDDGPWYQVYCRPDVAAWVRTQDPNSWMETGSHASLGNFFDIRDSVMTMLALKWA